MKSHSTKRITRTPTGLELPKVEVSFNQSIAREKKSPPKLPPEEEEAAPVTEPIVHEVTRVIHQAERRRLPSERQAIIHKFVVDGEEGFITVGLYDDGSPGEIFLRLAKSDATLSGLFDTIALTISLGLQYGVPIEAYVSKLLDQSFAPYGITTNPNIPEAQSILDYLARWLAFHFLDDEALMHIGLATFSTISNEQLTFGDSIEDDYGLDEENT